MLEKSATTILQPDLCHCDGIMEGLLIAGMAEAYYVTMAPHNPLGPIATAVAVHLDASIPNFMCQEHRPLGEGYLKEPLEFDKGYVKLSPNPGLGIELDMDAMEDKIDHDWRNPKVVRSGGWERGGLVERWWTYKKAKEWRTGFTR